MPRSKTARTALAAVADSTPPVVPVPPAAIFAKYRGWFGKVTRLSTIEEGPQKTLAIVIQSEKEADAVEALFGIGKQGTKDVNTYFRKYEQAVLDRARQKKKVKDAALARFGPACEMMSRGIVTWRQSVKDGVAKKARREAERERKRLEKSQAKEVARLRRAASKLTGQARKDLTVEADAVAAQGIQSVDSFVRDAVDDVHQSFRGAGKKATQRHYRAVCDDKLELICAVVASNPELRARVRDLAQAISKGEADAVSPAALEVYMPELNQRAKAEEDGLRIPGVRAVWEDKAGNT